MRGPIPIEPMHSFFYGRRDRRHISRGRVRTQDDDLAQHGVNISQPMHAAYTSAICCSSFISCSINSCQSIRCPVLHDYIAGCEVARPFLKLIADQVIDFHLIAGSGIITNY